MMHITSLPTDITIAKDFIGNRKINHLILRDNLTSYQTADRANKYQEIAEGTRLGIPLVMTSNPRNHVGALQFGISEASGKFSLWPGSLGLAAANDPALVRQFAEIARKEWRSAGIQKIYGYQIEIASEPRWRRISGTFGEGTELNAAIARELVLGFQGEKLGSESVAQTVKHFPGDGAVNKGFDPHGKIGEWAVYPTAGSLFKYQLPPFQAAIDAGASSIMSYYNRPSNAMSVQQLGEPFEEVAGAYNKAFITDLLDEMGFKGYVNSDSGMLAGMAFGMEEFTLEQRYQKAIRAGLNIFSDVNNPQPLIDTVNHGLLTEEELNPSVSQLLFETFELGLFENPYVDPDLAQQIADDPTSQAIADKAHLRSIVLMRNDSKLLPLSDSNVTTKKLYIEVFNGNSSVTRTTDLKKMIRQYDPTVQIVENLEDADEALVWALPSTYQAPTNPEEVSIELNTNTGINVDRIKAIEAAVPTILAINMTNPWVIEQIEPGAKAVVATFDVNAEALIDVLRGRFNPTGKLPLTIPKDEDAVKKNASDVPGYAESFDYTYKNAVGDSYTFGFGLSY
jgi:beta-glucosidase